MDKIIYHCKQITKSEIERAMQDGAKTFEDIQKMTGACTGNQCKELNPMGVCCSFEIFKIIKNNRPKEGETYCCSQK
jgi:bacterioferritin-associated ferredoxin